jgi:hypothetical protein
MCCPVDSGEVSAQARQAAPASKWIPVAALAGPAGSVLKQAGQDSGKCLTVKVLTKFSGTSAGEGGQAAASTRRHPGALCRVQLSQAQASGRRDALKKTVFFGEFLPLSTTMS